jgi:hypothetical protein
MRALSHFIVKVADLVEAEGRTLRASVARLVMASSVALAASVVLAAGVCVVAWAIFLALDRQLGTPGAAAIAGGTLLGVAAMLFAFAHRSTSGYDGPVRASAETEAERAATNGIAPRSTLASGTREGR